MRANTKKKHEMGRRFAIVIGVAAVGVMALGAQTATAGGPDLKLSGSTKQDPTTLGACDRGACALQIEVSCGDEACTASAKGKLTNVKNDKLKPGSVDVPPGRTYPLRLVLTMQTRIKAGEALAEGKNVKAKVTVRATDAAGNVATAKRTIRLVKGACAGSPCS